MSLADVKNKINKEKIITYISYEVVNVCKAQSVQLVRVENNMNECKIVENSCKK